MKNKKIAICIETLSIVILLLTINYLFSSVLPVKIEISKTTYWLINSLIATSIILVCFWFVLDKKKASFSFFLKKLRFQKITKKTIYRAFAVFLIAAILSGLIDFLLKYLGVSFDISERSQIAKTHKQNESLVFMILYSFYIVVLGPLKEEILFRGYLLPKQEAILGNYAWILNGFVFILVHLLVYDFASLLLLAPFSFLIAYKVQKHKNTSIGLLAHFFANLPFIIRLILT